MKIGSRRYLGGKQKLTPFIREIVDRECHDVERFFDVFAGTGVVSAAFLDKTLFVNDSLYVNYLSYLTWFSNERHNPLYITALIARYNALEDSSEENYMSENFADAYFSKKTCIKIGRIREDIENRYKAQEINERERAILITSLIYAIDKVANTCGHYDAYRKGAEFHDDFIMETPEITESLSPKNQCFNEDANVLAKKLVCDLAYLDPPYNSRQYCDLYHVLENVARWEKPQTFGVARKMDRTNLKSAFCTNDALKAFERLVDDLDCRYILLSYNNAGDKANGRSNARLSDEQILQVLSRKGKVKVFSRSHKAFTTGKSHNVDNEERLFLCGVEF